MTASVIDHGAARKVAHALAYLSLGWNVLPVIASTKKPAIRWKELQYRHATADEVRHWFRTWPAANLAIVTGAISGVVVLDLDGPEGLENARAQGELPPDNAPRVRTRNGVHFYLRHPGHVLTPWANPSDVERIPAHLRGIDFRGDGGYVVAPPSVHATGHRYVWEVPPHGFSVD